MDQVARRGKTESVGVLVVTGVVFDNYVVDVVVVVHAFTTEC